jgi:glutamine amidotransferase
LSLEQKTDLYGFKRSTVSLVLIVDGGLGSVFSVRIMFERLGITAEPRQSPEGLSDINRDVLPGIGAFDENVNRLQVSGWCD